MIDAGRRRVVLGCAGDLISMATITVSSGSAIVIVDPAPPEKLTSVASCGRKKTLPILLPLEWTQSMPVSERLAAPGGYA